MNPNIVLREVVHHYVQGSWGVRVTCTAHHITYGFLQTLNLPIDSLGLVCRGRIRDTGYTQERYCVKDNTLYT